MTRFQSLVTLFAKLTYAIKEFFWRRKKMKIIKIADNQKRVVLSHREWVDIGIASGWIKKVSAGDLMDGPEGSGEEGWHPELKRVVAESSKLFGDIIYAQLSKMELAGHKRISEQNVMNMGMVAHSSLKHFFRTAHDELKMGILLDEVREAISPVVHAINWHLDGEMPLSKDQVMSLGSRFFKDMIVYYLQKFPPNGPAPPTPGDEWKT
jgi:hypothetical protein